MLRAMFYDAFVFLGSPRATTEVEANMKNAKNSGISSRFPTDGANCGVQKIWVSPQDKLEALYSFTWGNLEIMRG